MTGASASLPPARSSASAGTASAPPAGNRNLPRRNFAARLFGHDLFISFAMGPPPRGSHSYASDLARRLRERDFTVFFSEEEAPPGEELDGTLRKALHGSRLLVVIANRGTLKEPRWVRKEVEEFRRQHPDRPVIPISVDGSLEDAELAAQAQPWLAFQDKIWLDESAQAVETGIAGTALIDRLATAPIRVRANVWWRRLVVGVVTLLAILAVGLAFFWQDARDSAQRARLELRRSTVQRLAGEVPAMLAGESPGGDERALQLLLAANRLGEPPAQLAKATLTSLQQLAGLVRLQDTGSPIYAVAASPDGERVAVGDLDGRLRLWNVGTGELLSTAEPSKESIRALAFSPDGRRLATASAGQLWLWDGLSGKIVAEPPAAQADEFHAPIGALVYAPDGRAIVTGGQNLVRFWDAATGREADRMEVGPEGIAAVAISPDGRLLVAGDATAVMLWRRAGQGWQSGNLERVDLDPSNAEEPAEHLYSAAFSPDGKLLVVGGFEGAVTLWEATSGKLRRKLQAGAAHVISVSYSGDGRRLLAGDALGNLYGWDAADYGSRTQLLAGQRGAVGSLSVVPGRSEMVSGGTDGMLRIWDLDAPDGHATVVGQADAAPAGGGALNFATAEVVGLEFEQRPGSRRLISSHADGQVRLWDLDIRPPQPLAMAPAAPRPSRSYWRANDRAVFGPDGKTVVAGGDEHQLRLWDAATGRLIGQPPAVLTGDVSTSIRFVAGGAQVLTADLKTSAVRRWDARTGALLDVVTPWDGRSSSLALDIDGQQVVRGQDNGFVEVWHRATGSVEPAQNGNAVRDNAAGIKEQEAVRRIRAVAFSPDGRSFASGAGSGTLRLWSTTPMQPRGRLMEGHSTRIRSIAFSPDGRSMVSAADDGARLWDTTIGAPIGVLDPGGAGVTSVAFSADGRSIVLGAADGRLRELPGPARWAELLCAKLTHNMSRAQWRAWVSTELEYVTQCPGLPEQQDRR